MLSERDQMLLKGYRRFPEAYQWGFRFSESLLQEELTLQEAAEALGFHIPSTSDNPFEDMIPECRQLFMLWKKGDVIRRWRTPDRSWRMRAGRAGIALIRNGKIIDGILTTVN